MEPAQNQIALLRERPGRALCMGYSDPREMLTTVIAWTVILIVIELCSFGGIDWFVFITIAIAWLVIGLI